MNQFSFLSNIKFKEDITEGVIPRLKLPTGPRLRVYSNGKIFPSVELMKFANLEYKYGTNEGCGIDFFKSTDWKPYPADSPQAIIISFIPRTEKKIDLFAGVKSDGKSVLKHGPKSEQLLNCINEIFPAAFGKEKYIDLVIDISTPIKTEDGIYNIPKLFKKGENKNKATYTRRENITLYPAAPENWVPITEIEEDSPKLKEALEKQRLADITVTNRVFREGERIQRGEDLLPQTQAIDSYTTYIVNNYEEVVSHETFDGGPDGNPISEADYQ